MSIETNEKILDTDFNDVRENVYNEVISSSRRNQSVSITGTVNKGTPITASQTNNLKDVLNTIYHNKYSAVQQFRTYITTIWQTFKAWIITLRSYSKVGNYDDHAGCDGECRGLCAGCSGTCLGTCTNACAEGCNGNCTGTCEGCTGTCDDTCDGSCSGSCGGCDFTCEGGCAGSCSGGCSGGCIDCGANCATFCGGSFST